MVHLVGYFGCAAISIVMMGVVFHALVWPTLKCRKKSVLGWVVSVVFGFGMLHSMAVKPSGGEALQGPRRSTVQQAATNDTQNIETTASSNLWESTLAVKSVICTPTNFTIEAAWPTGFFDEANKIDCFVSTSSPASNFNWVTSLPVAQTDTNCFFTIDPNLLGTNAMPRQLFAKVADRISVCSTMMDDDGDGIPASYEFFYGTNPYLDDAAAIPRLRVGPGGTHPDLTSALAASAPYSIIQLEATETASSSFVLPDHPVLISGPRNGYSVIRSSADHGAFKIMDGQDYRTMLRNIYLVLEKRDSFQVGFYCGRNLPWTGNGATPTFENIVVRTPRSETQYIGWLYYCDNGETSILKNCLVNALGATKVRGVEIGNGPSVLLSDVTFTNFPASSEQTLSRTFARGNNGQTNTIVRQGAEATVFVDLTPGLDSDDDGIPNNREHNELGTDPWLADSDGDGIPDPDELTDGTNPLDVLSFKQDVSIHVTNTTDLAGSSVTILKQVNDESPTILTNSATRGFDCGFSFNHSTNRVTVIAFRDLNADGRYSETADVLIRREIKSNSLSTRIVFNFGDIDGDGNLDHEEKTNNTDPLDALSCIKPISIRITNTKVDASRPIYFSWGSSNDTLGTNDISTITGGSFSTCFNARFVNGQCYAHAFWDINRNGEYEPEYDVILSKVITLSDVGKETTLKFGDIDGDGVSDVNERTLYHTDPYDNKSLTFSCTACVVNVDPVSTITNYYATANSEAITGSEVWRMNNANEFYVSQNYTTQNGYGYIHVFRDVNGNGVYDAAADIHYAFPVTKNTNTDFPSSFGDNDNDGVYDSNELTEGTNPKSPASYCFNPVVTVWDVFPTSNQLSRIAHFGTNVVNFTMTNVGKGEKFVFGHLATSTGESLKITYWDDLNGDGLISADEPETHIDVKPYYHGTDTAYQLPYGPFDANKNQLPDYWEELTGLSTNGVAYSWNTDTDGDGLINQYEYWSRTNPLVPDGSNTAISVAMRSIDGRLTSETSGRISTYEHYKDTNRVRNVNCWTYGIDMTAVSPWNETSKGERAGVLISSNHVAMAAHFRMSNTNILFYDQNNQEVKRRVIGGMRVHASDAYIAILDEPVPPSIHPVKLLPPNFFNALGTGTGLPGLYFDQEEHSLVCEFSSLPFSHGSSSGHCPEDNIRSLYFESVIGGDSGNPRFMVFGNELALITTFYQGIGGSGPFYTSWAMEVQKVMNNLSITHGKPLSQLNFVDLVNVEVNND